MKLRKSSVGAVNAQAHINAAIPAAQLPAQHMGTEFGDMVPNPLPPTVRGRRYRAATTTTTPADQIALGDSASVRIGKHLSEGSPNPRQVDSQIHGVPTESPIELVPEHFHNERRGVVGSARSAAPTRARQGWGTEDNTRPSRSYVAFLLRPFNQRSEWHPGAVGKVDLPDPHAARSRDVPTMPHAIPAPGGRGTSSAKKGIATQPNTYRVLPKPWDQLLVNTGGPAAQVMGDPAHTASSSQARRGWGAR